MFTWSFFVIFGKNKLKKILFIVILLMLFMLPSCSKHKEQSFIKLSSSKYKQFTPNQKLHYLDSLSTLSHSLPNDSLTRSALLHLSSEYYFLNRSQQSYDLSKNAFQLAKKVKDSSVMAKSLYYMGDSYEITHKDSAYFYYQEAEKLYRLLDDTKMTGRMLFNKAYVLFYEGNYLESEIQVAKALQLLKNSDDQEMLFTCYNLLASNFERMEEYDEGLHYYLMAQKNLSNLKKYDSKKNNFDVSLSVNIANIYEKQHQFLKAKKELELVITPDLKNKWPNEYATVIGNLGYVLMKLGDFKKSKTLLLESLSISEKSGIASTKIYKLSNLGEYFAVVGDTAKSIYYLKQSLQLAEQFKQSDNSKLALELLSKIDFKNSLKYNKRYIALSDSLAKVQRKSRNKYARIAYETSTVEENNKVLTERNLYLLLGILLLSFVLVIWFWYARQKEFNYRQKLQDAELELFELMQSYQTDLTVAKEKEQNRIAKELHDTIMNRLYGIRLQLGLHNSSDKKESKEKIDCYIDELQILEKDIRAVVHDLHTDEIATQFDYLFLLSKCIKEIQEVGLTNCNFESDPMIDWGAISSLVKITIYRIVQEAMSNMHKYANASQCYVQLYKETPSKLILRITDNGSGFDSTSLYQGIGLKNMKERATQARAEFVIESVLQQGTTIKCSFTV